MSVSQHQGLEVHRGWDFFFYSAKLLSFKSYTDIKDTAVRTLQQNRI